MKNKHNQIYEEYWSYTAAFTDMNGPHFLSVLRTCIQFLDGQPDALYSTEKYEQLQNQICQNTGVGALSARKAINQLVKLGFLKPHLQGYIPEAKEYLNAATDRKRQSLLSKIVYRHCNFNNSMTRPDVSGYGQINFFLKTLEHIGTVDDRALVALMAIDIDKYPNGFLGQKELDRIYDEASFNGFAKRKYNQISHLKNLLGRLDDLQVHEDKIYFKTDALRLFGNDGGSSKSVRDPYLQRVYKSELEEESLLHFGGQNPKCMLEGLAHPVLIASHIKPYRVSNPEEAFDVNNGLLLSKSIDSLFDLGYITFKDDGAVETSVSLDNDLSRHLSHFRLHPHFINQKRLDYMQYHRNFVFEKRFSANNTNTRPL